MKVKYFEATDTLYIEFTSAAIASFSDLDENTLLELDEEGRVCALTLEHASKRTDASSVSFERIAA